MNPRRLIRVLFGLALLAPLVGGCATGRLDPRTAQFDAPAFTPPPVEERALASGVRLFLREEHELPYVRLTFYFRGGSIHDPAEKSGLSRVAASAWRAGGTEALSPEAFDDALDARGIELSIAPGRETGAVSLGLLRRDLDEGLSLLASLLLTPAFDAERFAWVRAKVREGVVRAEEEPEAVAFREFRRAFYRGHPRAVSPSPASIEAVTREDAVAFQRTLVADSAWTVAAVGDFDTGELIEGLDRLFGVLKSEGDAFPALPPPPEPTPGVVLVPRELAQATVIWGSFAPALDDPERAPFQLADEMTGGGGFQSRLVRSVRSDRGLAYSVGSFYSPMKAFGVFGVHAKTAPDSLSEVVGLLDAELRRAKGEGFGPEETAAAREGALNRHIFQYRDTASVVNRRAALALEGLPLYLDERYPAEIGAVDDAAASRAARAFIRPDAGVWVVVGPVDPADPVWAGRGAVEVVRP